MKKHAYHYKKNVVLCKGTYLPYLFLGVVAMTDLLNFFINIVWFFDILVFTCVCVCMFLSYLPSYIYIDSIKQQNFVCSI